MTSTINLDLTDPRINHILDHDRLERHRLDEKYAAMRKAVATGEKTLNEVTLREITPISYWLESWGTGISGSMNLFDFSDKISFNSLVRITIKRINQITSDFRYEPRKNYSDYYFNVLKTISEVLTVINAMLDCKIDLMGLDSEKFINREQEYLEYCRKKLVKFSLYILKEYDMLHILEIEDFLKSDLDKLLVDLNLKRKGQEGYLEQQALLVDLKDIELAQYIKNKSPEEFSNEPLTNYLSRDEWWCEMLCKLNKNLQEIEMDEDFWYYIFIGGKGFPSVTRQMRHNEKFIKAILQKNQEEIFNILGDDAHLKNIINSIRTLGNKSDVTDEEFQIIKSSLTDKLLANLPLKLFINNYSFATIQKLIDSDIYFPLGISDLLFKDGQDTPVNYFSFACAFITLCINVEISNNPNCDNYQIFKELDKKYIEDIIEKNGLREVLNNLRTVNGESKLTDDEYQRIVCDVYDTFIDTFSISEGRNY